MFCRASSALSSHLWRRERKKKSPPSPTSLQLLTATALLPLNTSRPFPLRAARVKCMRRETCKNMCLPQCLFVVTGWSTSELKWPVIWARSLGIYEALKCWVSGEGGSAAVAHSGRLATPVAQTQRSGVEAAKAAEASQRRRYSPPNTTHFGCKGQILVVCHFICDIKKHQTDL